MKNFSSNIFLFSLCLFLLAPILFIVITAFNNTTDIIIHLIQTVLFKYFTNTLYLMLGVAILSLVFGVSTAWVVSRFSFYGRDTIEWMLVLPAAIPAYIVAYTYTDFLEYSGPLQTAMRNYFLWSSSSDYWFPEIRSYWAAMIIMSSVLYPYIYLLTRTSFRNTSRYLFEASIVANKNILFDTALPLARPAIVAGLALVLMEVVSDFGTVEYFALETLTLGIFNVWLGMNDISAAAQLSIFTFFIIGILIIIEIIARSRRSFQNLGSGNLGLPQINLIGNKAILAIMICLFPIFVGFIFPVIILLKFILSGYFIYNFESILNLIFNSLFLSFVSGFLILSFSLIIASIVKYKASRFGKFLGSASAIGYAFPGTILAIGVLSFTNYLDKNIFLLFNENFIIGNTLIVLFIGLLVRFQAVGYGAIISGINRLPPFLMESGRILGKSFENTYFKIIFPLLKPSLLVGFLLVFVDVMKELPMTLLLRPFSFETFATFTYQYAKDELLEQAALPALMIVLVGLLPVIVAHKTLKKL